LPSSMHTPWAGSNRYKISELMSFTAGRPLPVDSPSLPFCVRFNVALRRRRQHYGFTLLIDTLQHSIRSLWLRATPAGVPPACLQTISSPHVHFFVRRLRPVRGIEPLALLLGRFEHWWNHVSMLAGIVNQTPAAKRPQTTPRLVCCS
jgi:hypothetical protein